MEGSGQRLIRLMSQFLPERLWNATKDLRIVPAEIRTEHHPNTSQRRYILIQLSRMKSLEYLIKLVIYVRSILS
jgi:hypothetical protein